MNTEAVPTSGWSAVAVGHLSECHIQHHTLTSGSRILLTYTCSSKRGGLHSDAFSVSKFASKETRRAMCTQLLSSLVGLAVGEEVSAAPSVSPTVGNLCSPPGVTAITKTSSVTPNAETGMALDGTADDLAGSASTPSSSLTRNISDGVPTVSAEATSAAPGNPETSIRSLLVADADHVDNKEDAQSLTQVGEATVINFLDEIEC